MVVTKDVNKVQLKKPEEQSLKNCKQLLRTLGNSLELLETFMNSFELRAFDFRMVVTRISKKVLSLKSIE